MKEVIKLLRLFESWTSDSGIPPDEDGDHDTKATETSLDDELQTLLRHEKLHYEVKNMADEKNIIGIKGLFEEFKQTNDQREAEIKNTVRHYRTVEN